MRIYKVLSMALALFAAFAIFAPASQAQVGFYFGQNKVHYKDFDWAVLRTEHFDVHYYSEEAEAALDAARMAERAYAYLSDVMDHQVRRRIPIILYASLNDFQQTNVVSGLLGDGTRGVTEGLRNRVTLPITGSYREFNHVLVHELVHAFQFDILTGGQGANTLGRIDIPLWFIEGMAEYLSVGMDNITRSWVRDGLINNKLLTISQLSNSFDIRVYRLGEAVWYYVGETYGKKKIGQILKTAVRLGAAEAAFVAQIGMNFEKLTQVWKKAMRKLALPSNETLNTPVQIAQQVTKQTSYYHRMNVVPAISPDGKMIAYVANKNLTDEIYLLRQREDGKFVDRAVVKGGSSKNFESLRFLETSINWSPDSRWIAFVSKVGRDDAIYIMDPLKRKVVHKLVFKHLNGLLSPSFSPTGDQLVFVGISGGISDLYIADLDGRNLRRLTQNRFAEFDPQWSPDGKSIVFVTERGPGSDENRLLFGDYDLGLYSLATGRVRLLTNLKGNAINPRWGADSRTIVFVADHQGIPNIYALDLDDQRIIAITSLLNGVVGITENTPAMSLSADGRRLAFSSFWKGGWQIFRAELTEPITRLTHADEVPLNVPGEALATPVGKTTATVTDADSLWLPAVSEPNDVYSSYSLAKVDSVELRKYSNKLSLEGASVGGSIGGFFGPVGGAQFLFGDLLGNHNLLVSTALQFDFLRPDVGVAYINQARRLNFGLSGFQSTSRFGTLVGGGALGIVRQTYRGGSLFAVYPFSRFARVELGAGLINVAQDISVQTFQGGRRGSQSFGLGHLTFAQFSTALVFDNIVFGPAGPMAGSRSRFSVLQTTNDFQSTTLLGDYRRYFKVSSRSVIAYRMLAGTSKGRDAQVFSIGGPYTYRGADFGDLFGTNFLVQNIEYRFPMFPFAPPAYDYLAAAAFVDAAGAWGIDVPGLAKSTFQPFSTDGGFHLQDLKLAFGIGARFRLGYFDLRYDLAWPTNLRSVDGAFGRFSIGFDY